MHAHRHRYTNIKNFENTNNSQVTIVSYLPPLKKLPTDAVYVSKCSNFLFIFLKF